jgi:hypothetical protein
MSQADAPPPAPPPPKRPRGVLLPQEWRVRTRWFAAEFLVVVTGILMAFALQAWWDGRAEALREQSFRAQLLADARENQRRIDAAIVTDSSSQKALERLTAALRSPAALPPDDSLRSWLRVNSASFRPLVGTLATVQQAGGGGLLREDRVRIRITAYAGEMQAILAQLGALEAAVLESGPQLYSAVERHVSPGGVPNFVSMKTDPALIGALRFQRVISLNRLIELRRLREQTEQLIHLLEGAP